MSNSRNYRLAVGILQIVACAMSATAFGLTGGEGHYVMAAVELLLAILTGVAAWVNFKAVLR